MSERDPKILTAAERQRVRRARRSGGEHGRRCGFPRRNGTKCRNYAGMGTPHPGHGRCWKHGGNTPTHVRSGQLAAAREAVVLFGLPRQVHPQQALLEEVWRTAGHVEWLGERLRQETAESAVGGQVEEKLERAVRLDAEGNVDESASSSAAVLTRVTAERPSVWLKLYQEERAHLVTVCKTAIACGIAERQVRLAEGQGKLLAQAFAGLLADLGLDRNDPAVRSAVRRRLEMAASSVIDLPTPSAARNPPVRPAPQLR